MKDINKIACQFYVSDGTTANYPTDEQWKGKFMENGRILIHKAGKAYNAACVEL